MSSSGNLSTILHELQEADASLLGLAPMHGRVYQARQSLRRAMAAALKELEAQGQPAVRSTLQQPGGER
nr:hypothetical protein [uncultured Holophaga sp.]